MNKNYDILIVGGGLTGLSLAIALAHLPINIAIIEAKPPEAPTLSKDNRALALSSISQRILSTQGLWTSISAQAMPIQKIHVSHRGHFGAVHFCAEQAKVDAFGYVVPASHLLNVLQQAVFAHQKITYLAPAHIQSLHADESGHHVDIKTQRNQFTLNAKLIVAADGSNSLIRQLKNIEVITKNYHQSAIVGEVMLSRKHQNVAYERFMDGGALALLPLTEQTCVFIWTIPSAKLKEYLDLSDAAFLQQLQNCFGYRSGRFVSTHYRQTYPLQMLYAKQQVLPGIVLLGNAAHTLHPIAAQGFNLGLRDCAALADIISKACAVKANPGDISWLNQYVKWRTSDQALTMRFTDHITKLFSNRVFSITHLLDLGLFSLDMMPFIKNSFAKKSMGMIGKLPRLACGLAVN